MSTNVIQAGSYKPVTATGNISPIPCSMLGIFVSSATAGTITVYDSATTETTTPIVQTFTAVPGTFHPLPFVALNGVYIVVGGTLVATVAYAAT